MNTDYVQYLKDLAELLIQAANIPKEIVEGLSKNDMKQYIEEPGVKSMLDYTRKGGKTVKLEIEDDYIKEFRDKMKREHINFIEIENTKEDGSLSYTYLFQEKDKSRVNQIKKTFELELSKNSAELDIYTFRELMKNREISAAKNLTREEIYAFRNNVKNTNLKYVVTSGADGKYNIYANNMKKLTDTLTLAAYDLSSEKGQKYKDDINSYVNKKNNLFEKINDKDIFIIADSKNPNNFIYCGPDGYSIHSFAKKTEIRDGQEVDIIKDVVKPTIYSYEDKEHIMNIVGQYNNAVILNVEDFLILDNISKDGKAYASDTIEHDYMDIVEQNKNRIPDIDKFPRIKNKDEYNLVGYSHLPMSLLDQMKIDMSHIDIKMDNAGNIAFDKQYRKEIDRYLDTQYFDKIEQNTNYFKRMSNEWQVKNKAGHNKVDFEKPDFCIIDTYNGQISAKVDKEGIHIYNGSEEVKTVSSDISNYNDELKSYIQDYAKENAVILTNDEMQSENKNQIILERANGLYINDAVVNVINTDNIEKKQLLNTTIDNKDLSPAQYKALDRVNNIQLYTEEYTSRTFREMQDLNISHKYERTETHTETHTNSHSL